MREIKFRGKRKDNGEWVYGDFLKDTDYHFCIRERVSGVTHYVDLETVGQLTGEKDRDGKDVFEGDIVSITPGGYKSVIIYENGSFWENCNDKKIQKIRLGAWGDTPLHKVIGTVHNNPELLEKGES